MDEALFVPRAWFFIDAENRRVPGVSAATLPQALALVGHGKVAATVGRLRPEFRVIDVDLEDVRGEAVTEILVEQIRQRSWWHLVRPSGGADGRHHVFVHSEGHDEELLALVETVRGGWGLAKKKLELRDTVRPLTSPHRQGVRTEPLGDQAAACGALLELTERMPAPHRPRSQTRRTPRPSKARSKGWNYRSEQPLAPRPRPRTELEEKWRVYLATGRKPAWARAHDSEGTDTSGSTYELMCTAAMLRAGWSHDEAWAAINAAHPDAMSHARRETRQRWTTHVWNAAARADAEFVPTPSIDAHIWAATQQARQRVHEAAWSLSVRQRPSFLCTAEAVLRRMESAGTLRVPVPERDLVLDTGISDRGTVRMALRRLDGRVGALHRDCFDPSDKSGSSYEFSIPAAQVGVSEIPPPSFHTPLRTQLPSTPSPLTWLTLTQLHPSHPLTPSELCLLLQRTPTSGAEPTPSLVRHETALLHELQVQGLALCDANGRWTRPTELPSFASQRHEDHAELVEQVASERAAWRSGYVSEWTRQRDEALAHTRERASRWWAALSQTDRERRLGELSTRFDREDITSQRTLKQRLRHRDQEAGIDPLERRRSWWASLSAAEQKRRREQRLERWARMSKPEQIAHARAWEYERRALRELARVRSTALPRERYDVGAL